MLLPFLMLNKDLQSNNGIHIYSTLFAVDQYSSKKIDEKERETEQNNQKKQIYK